MWVTAFAVLTSLRSFTPVVAPIMTFERSRLIGLIRLPTTSGANSRVLFDEPAWMVLENFS